MHQKLKFFNQLTSLIKSNNGKLTNCDVDSTSQAKMLCFQGC